MGYLYRMIQMPPNIEVQEKSHKGNEAAAYLENIVNDMSADGWEFYRVDEIGVSLKSGCLASLFGSGDKHTSYYVITFRRAN